MSNAVDLKERWADGIKGYGLSEIGMVIILFTNRAPDTLSEELTREGIDVYEALAISEVLALAERHPFSSIIITPDVDRGRAQVIAQHYPTVRLHERFSAALGSVNQILKKSYCNQPRSAGATVFNNYLVCPVEFGQNSYSSVVHRKHI